MPQQVLTLPLFCKAENRLSGSYLADIAAEEIDQINWLAHVAEEIGWVCKLPSGITPPKVAIPA